MSIYRDSKRIVGTNADRIGSDAISGGWKELARTTLGSVGDDITVSSLSDKRYYMVLNYVSPSTNYDCSLRLNGDSGTNYASRWSNDGGTDFTGTSVAQGVFGIRNEATSNNAFNVGYITNLSTKEKLGIGHGVHSEGSGAGTAPVRREAVTKHAQTSNPISEIQIHNIHSGDFASGSECVVLGYDPDDTHTDNFWEELASSDWSSGSSFDSGTFTAKKYLWVQGYVDSATINYHPLITVGNTTLDTGSNYAFRRSYDGNTDATATSQSSWEIEMSGTASPKFFNLFIVNNASNEKLGIMHAVAQLTAGAGTAPSRRETVCKWANTSNQINIIGLKTTTGDFASGSFIKVWGSD